ncbi:MAG: DUF4230 domain-containing protein [Bacilli bacterium]|nr:DUF4230 domain-containing protein [Bacilli bacterium]
MLKKLGMKTLLVGGCIILVVTTCMVGVVTTFNQKFKVTDLGLKDMSELVTQTCTVTVIQDSKKNLTFFKDYKIPLTESRQIFSYDFDVDASIKFNKITFDVDNKNKTITFNLPHANVYKTSIILDSFNSYYESDSLFTEIDLSENNDAKKQMAIDAEEKCIKNKLLENADKNAEELLKGLVKSNSKIKDYKVLFKYNN